MTPRAVRVLREADLIAAEDTRHTRQLLTHFGIHGQLISYHEHNKENRGRCSWRPWKKGRISPWSPMRDFPGFPIRGK